MPVTDTVMDPMLAIVSHVEHILILITGDTAFVTTDTSDTTVATITTGATPTTTTITFTDMITITMATMMDIVILTATTLVGVQKNMTVTSVVTTHTWTHGDTVPVTTDTTEITVTSPMMDTTDMDIPMNVEPICTTMNMDTAAVTSTGRVTTVTSMYTTHMTHTKDHVTQSVTDAQEATQLSVTFATTMPTGTAKANVSVTSTGLVTIV
jgi:hypothetical protein